MESAGTRRPSRRTWRQGCYDDRIQEQGNRSAHRRAQDHAPAMDDDCVPYFPDGTVKGGWPMTTPTFAFPVRFYGPPGVGKNRNEQAWGFAANFARTRLALDRP